jgi:adenylate cyclase
MTQHLTRQLVAVMFADMVGYTAMMQIDEQNAIKKRNRHKEVLEHLIPEHQGKILQYYGDGSLSTFSSAIEAVNCAIEIQQELQKEPKVPLRIGIHTGDIVYEDNDVYGDGVNVASRVEGMAAPGGVLISDKVYDDIKNHPYLKTTSLGYFELKNVKRKVELFALTNDGLPVPTREEAQQSKRADIKTIAVLPFVNMSSDRENEYFSEGITEEIINVLTKIDGLDVTARTSSFAFKGKNMDIREIGSKLGVSVILEGSVRKAGNRVRITSQLVDTKSGFHIFSEDYDRDLKDIFALQDEISLLIANKLRQNFAAAPGRIIREAPPTNNLDAYDVYLKGRHNLGKGSYDGASTSLTYFKKAIEMDPQFALPYTAISLAYLFLGISRYAQPKESYEKAKQYASLAQKIDDNLAETHLAIARLCCFHDWDMICANRSIQKALQLSPGSAEVRGTYALFLLIEGHLEAARAEAEISINSDPFSLFSNFVLASVYYGYERYEEAVVQCDLALQKLPSFQQAHVIKSKALLCAGETDRALEAFNQIPSSPNRITLEYATMAVAHAIKGETDKIHECLEKVKEQEKTGTAEFLNWSYTLIYLALKDTDKVFYYLEQCYQDKTVTILFLNVDPLFKEYRNDKRFTSLIHRALGKGHYDKD